LEGFKSRSIKGRMLRYKKKTAASKDGCCATRRKPQHQKPDAALQDERRSIKSRMLRYKTKAAAAKDGCCAT